MKISTILILSGGLSIWSDGSIQAKGNNTFFSCDQGYVFESKQDAARCIHQKRVAFKNPEPCTKGSKAQNIFRLQVDKLGNKDLCTGQLSSNIIHSISGREGKARSAKIKMRNPFQPKCASGYRLQIRRGRDACKKTNAEIIRPPLKRVRR